MFVHGPRGCTGDRRSGSCSCRNSPEAVLQAAVSVAREEMERTKRRPRDRAITLQRSADATIRRRAVRWNLYEGKHVAIPIVSESRHDFRGTLDVLTRAIVESGSTVFTVIDQSEAAAGAGMQLRPTSLVVFGNPKSGTPLMKAHPLLALDLPLKILVWAEDARTCVGYWPMADAASRTGVTEPEAIARMDAALQHLVGLVA
jgi:uncharacterized protein (DUF302 family)